MGPLKWWLRVLVLNCLQLPTIVIILQQNIPLLGSSQTWLFQTWLFAIFTWKRSFALFCGLLRSCVALLCAHLRGSANDRV